MDVREAIRAYLAEGIDIDDEGTYLERSFGVYDAVTNRSLLLFAEPKPVSHTGRITASARFPPR
jgi:hypothetical protein